ncbi:hypothetical protein GGI23_005211 [Coemansia sp. RSA 2559]|nr:hypothetical protein GGI23_005211 [Coemansia sp. RSA 2559]
MGTPVDPLVSDSLPTSVQTQQQNGSGDVDYSRRLWPKCAQLPDWKRNFPIYPGVGLEPLLPKLSTKGIDLLKRLLEYAPEKRISAEQALSHPYFDELRNMNAGSSGNV